MKTPLDASLGRRRLLKVAAVALALGALPLTVSLANAADGHRMKIGIIGTGKVGGGIGLALARAGSEVMFSSRNLDSDKQLAAEAGHNARAGSPQEAANFGQVVLLAVPYNALPDLIKSLGDSLKGKVVINASNPIARRDGEIANQARDKGVGLFDEQLMPGAYIVRAFNAVPAARMASAHDDPGKIGMPIAGDRKAIGVASRIVREVGFIPVVVGGLDMGKYLVPGTPLGGEHTPTEVRNIAATLKP